MATLSMRTLEDYASGGSDTMNANMGVEFELVDKMPQQQQGYVTSTAKTRGGGISPSSTASLQSTASTAQKQLNALQYGDVSITLSRIVDKHI
jgi:hypothetical protein